MTRSLRAKDLAGSFEAANKLYGEGKYADAANAYDRLVAEGNVSEPLYFNLGNAWFKLGQTGRAIAAYRQAQRLAPRDSDVRSNLQFARTHARGGTPYREEFWRGWLGRLSLNEWTILASVAVWAVFILLALGEWKAELKSRLRICVQAAIAAAIALGVCAGVALETGWLAKSAIVIVGEADVRNGPLDEAPSLFKVRDGTELEVRDEKDGWLQVEDASQRYGWLREDQVNVFGETGAEKKKI